MQFVDIGKKNIDGHSLPESKKMLHFLKGYNLRCYFNGNLLFIFLFLFLSFLLSFLYLLHPPPPSTPNLGNVIKLY